MNRPHDDMPEHDPEISALYRKTGNVEPSAKLDEAVLASARRALRQRRQRWILPLSTAAVLMLGITVLLKINSEWQPGDALERSAPAPAMHEEKAAGVLAKKAAPVSPEPRALRAVPPQQAARAKTEIAESLGAAADAAPMMDSTMHEAESPIIAGIAQTEQKALEPQPWIEKIRKLLLEKKPDEAKKELEAFRKHYPDYKLPNDLKSLIN